MISIGNATACVRPDFANEVTLPLTSKDIFVKENFSTMPGNSNCCVFTAVWVTEKIELGREINVYVATYNQDENTKISDFTFKIFAEMIWLAPEALVDKAAFNISDKVAAFGLRTVSVFWGGTFGEDKEQFDLILDDGKGKLRSVLSTRSSHAYQRDCGRGHCDEDDVRNFQLFIVSQTKTNNFNDILVKHYELRSQPTQRRKDRKKRLKAETHQWNGEQYVVK